MNIKNRFYQYYIDDITEDNGFHKLKPTMIETNFAICKTTHIGIATPEFHLPSRDINMIYLIKVESRSCLNMARLYGINAVPNIKYVAMGYK